MFLFLCCIAFSLLLCVCVVFPFPCCCVTLFVCVLCVGWGVGGGAAGVWAVWLGLGGLGGRGWFLVVLGFGLFGWGLVVGLVGGGGFWLEGDILCYTIDPSGPLSVLCSRCIGFIVASNQSTFRQEEALRGSCKEELRGSSVELYVGGGEAQWEGLIGGVA